MNRETRFATASDLPPMAVSRSDTTANKTGSWRYLRPVIREKLAPCRHACPAGTDLPRVLRMIGEGRWREAHQLILEENPLPGVCGRVCYRPCETACNRRHFDEAASIQALERFVADVCFDLPPEAAQPQRRKERIAIIGTGPAGLSCAYFLAREGFPVTMIEAASKPGGMLRTGIPRYRLPRRVLDREIGNIARLGVQILLDCRVGEQVTLQQLQQAFEAIFVATGAHRSVSLDLPGGNRAKIMPGLEFLKLVNAGQPPEIGKEVLVIGGGNTAMDAARAALRLRSRPLVAYRRSRAEMPAIPDEVEQAESEGVAFQFLASPLRLRKRNGRIEVEMIRMELGEMDSSGRPRPVSVPGSEFTLIVDSVLEAVGEGSELADLAQGLLVSEKGSQVLSEKESLQFLEAGGLLVGGDAATGAGTVVEAIASGKRAARQIVSRFSREREVVRPAEEPGTGIPFSDLHLETFTRSPRKDPPHRSVAERIARFTEVVGPLDAAAAVAEARRCFSCGVCNQCDNCWVFCPEGAVSRGADGYRLNLDYCKGCGICVQECPGGVISLVQEGQ